MPGVPRLAKPSPLLLVEHLVGREDQPRLGVVPVERRRVALQAAGQADRIPAQLNRHFAVNAVERDPRNVADLVVAVDRLPARLRVREQVRLRALVVRLDLHAGRVQRPQFGHLPIGATELELVGTAVEPHVQADLLDPLIPGLVAVRLLGEHAVDRQVLGPLRRVVVTLAVDVQRQAGDSLGHHSGTGHVGRRPHGGLGGHPHARLGSSGNKVIPAAHPCLKPADLGERRIHAVFTRRKVRASPAASGFRPCASQSPLPEPPCRRCVPCSSPWMA